jgi:hypothetical protein
MRQASDPPTVAALYVDPRGVYANLPGVEVWDEKRDARTYPGPWPVVAHPPCNRWSYLSAGRSRGQDGGCFAAALAAVREFGGVLEHPAHSQAWAAFDLPRPARGGWVARLGEPGAAVEVDQWLYGFPTRKRTWLYAASVELVGLRDGPVLATRGCENLHSGHRSRTPATFRDVLLDMARRAV